MLVDTHKKLIRDLLFSSTNMAAVKQQEKQLYGYLNMFFKYLTGR